MEACCTCARLLSAVPAYAEKSEKLLPRDRRLECCGRVICGDCLHKNTRFSTYCPYCQTTTTPSPLPQGLRDPPSYASLPPNPSADLLPPPYTALPPSHNHNTCASSPPPQGPQLSEKPHPPPPEPLLHFLDHERDTLPSLSLRYSVPAADIRSLNRLTSDHLLAARRTVLIPVPSSPSPSSSSRHRVITTSLSPTPPEGEDAEARKAAIRRWMVATKVPDYDVAVLYLSQAGYDLARALGRFRDDEAWERDHPLDSAAAGKKKGKRVSILRRG